MRGGGGHEQPTLVADEVQAGLHQPLEELCDDLEVFLRDGAWKGVHVGLHQWLPAKLKGEEKGDYEPHKG